MKKVLSIILSVVMLFGSLSVLSAVPAFAESNRVGAGETKVMVPEKPAGEGTQTSPYLISKPEHFYWIQQNTNDLEKASSSTVYDAAICGPSFSGVYFKQTADLDFSGYVFKESAVASLEAGAVFKYNAEATERDYMRPVGHYTTDTRIANDTNKPGNYMWGGFAGNYDGDGYAIRNVKISATGGGTNERWTLGLFGIIYGATLKNMVLDNVDVVVNNHNVSGILVGKAYAPVYDNPTDKKLLDDSKRFDFNVIENILITEDSSIIVKGTLKNNDDGSKTVTSNNGDGHYVGSIAGSAIGTTIKNCVNMADLKVGYACVGVGGILGIIGQSVLIDGCINRGNILFSNLEGVTKNTGAEKAFGGIVGYFSGASVSVDTVMSLALTGFTIQNCINEGLFSYDESTASVGTEYWGGILGGGQQLPYLGANSTYKYMIKNSHNTVVQSNSGIQRMAGIVGCVFIGNGANASPMYIENCFSVDVAETNKYYQTNEIISPTERNTAAKEKPVILVGANSYKSNGTQFVMGGSSVGNTKATVALTDKIWVENAAGNGVTEGTKTFQELVDEITAEITKDMDLGEAGPDPELVAKVVEKAAKTCDHTDAQHTAAPEGKGTKAEPYLIDSYDDLVWIAEGVKDAWDNTQYGEYAIEGVSASYTGVYFKQTADIDLGGNTLKAIGGYYKNTSLDSDLDKVPGKEYMSAFGGSYDGNGFKIHNGTIVAANGAGQSPFWSVGLFGAIYGGTVEDVTLDKITFNYTVGRQFGGIVGQAITPTSGANAGNPEFNVIKDCVVKSTCTYAVTNSFNGTTKLNMGDGWAVGYYTGGIVGKAQATTISRCVNEAAIKVPAGTVAAGGIAALIGNGVVIEGCINKGIITFDGNMSTNLSAWMDYADISIGGITGTILGNANGMQSHNKLGLNGVKIRYSYNAGALKVAAGSVIIDVDNNGTGMSLQWGGIIGGINALPITSGKLPYIIENCYNTTSAKAADVKSPAENGKAAPEIKELRLGGIIGSAYVAGGADCDTLFIKDCLSVDGERAKYNGTNEASIHGNKLKNTTRGSGRAVTLLGVNKYLEDGTEYAVDDNKDKTYATREIGDFIYELTDAGYVLSTTIKFSDIIDLIDAGTIPAEEKVVISPVGVQKSLDGTKVRVIFGVYGIDYKNFKIAASTTDGKSFALSSQDAYTSYLSNSGTALTTHKATDFGYDYVMIYELRYFDPAVERTFIINSYATTQDGTEIYGDTLNLTFRNGDLVSYQIDTTGRYK